MNMNDDDRPPLLGSWTAIYAVVIGSLALYVILCAVVTAVYR